MVKYIQGDVIGVYNSSGTKLVTFTYDAYGNCTVSGDASLASYCKIRYRGYYFDTETGLYWVQTRYYNPEWCRWISPDTLDYLDPETAHGLNLYAYCGNDPVNFADPSGQSAIGTLVAFFFFGLFTGAVSGVMKQVSQHGFDVKGWRWQEIVGDMFISASLAFAFAAGGLVGIGAVSGLASGGLFVGSAMLSFAAGAGAYVIENYNNETFSINNMLIHGGINALNGIQNFGLGVFFGNIGMWNTLNNSGLKTNIWANGQKGVMKRFVVEIANYVATNKNIMLARTTIKAILSFPWQKLRSYLRAINES